MCLQENVLKEFTKKYSGKTIREQAAITGIGKSRIYRIISEKKPMKLKEYEAFLQSLNRKQEKVTVDGVCIKNDLCSFKIKKVWMNSYEKMIFESLISRLDDFVGQVEKLNDYTKKKQSLILWNRPKSVSC